MVRSSATDPLPPVPLPVPATVERALAPIGLPLPLTPLIGRERELAAARDRLLGQGVRLLTLTGPGGVGKTRIAVAVAADLVPAFDGVAFVPLAAIQDPGLVLATVAGAVGADADARSPRDALIALGRRRRWLLILDNFEQVLPAGPALTDLLAACPDLVVVVTSRSRLHLAGESCFIVPPLAVPPPTPSNGGPAPASLAENAAVRLFLDRAQAAYPDFAPTPTVLAAVAELCRRLDGLPLAIELAAARTRVLPPPALLRRLTTHLPLLTDGPRDAPPRLRSMRDAITWSHGLLTPDQQLLFRRLAVFVGGFDLDAAERVAGCGPTAAGAGGAIADRPAGVPGAPAAAPPPTILAPPPATLDVVAGLAALVDQSLVQRGEGPNGEARFTLLETVREFGLERLAASGDEEATIRDAHADHFLALAERAEPELSGANQTPWFDLLVAERPNLRAALGWLRDREDAPRLYRLAGALGLFWTWPPFLREGRAWLEATLAVPPAGVPARAIGRVLGATGTIAMWQNDVERAAAIFDRALAAWRAIDDPLEIAHALRNLGNVALHLGDVDRARDVVAESLARFRQLGEPWSVGLALATLATVDSACGDHDQAIARNDEALALFLALPGQRYSNVAQRNLAWEHLLRGDQANARRGYRQVLAHAREHDDRREVAACAEGAAGLAAAAGDQERAARLFAAAAALRAEEELALLPSTAAQLGALLDAVRVRLPAPAFAAAWRAGGRLTLAQTIAETDALLTASPLPASPAPSPMATPSPAGEAAARGLTRRQTDVLRLIVAGKTDREIAALLFITRRTASKHVSAVLAGLGVASRSAAAAAAVQRRLV